MLDFYTVWMVKLALNQSGWLHWAKTYTGNGCTLKSITQLTHRHSPKADVALCRSQWLPVVQVHWWYDFIHGAYICTPLNSNENLFSEDRKQNVNKTNKYPIQLPLTDIFLNLSVMWESIGTVFSLSFQTIQKQKAKGLIWVSQFSGIHLPFQLNAARLSRKIRLDLGR